MITSSALAANMCSQCSEAFKVCIDCDINPYKPPVSDCYAVQCLPQGSEAEVLRRISRCSSCLHAPLRIVSQLSEDEDQQASFCSYLLAGTYCQEGSSVSCNFVESTITTMFELGRAGKYEMSAVTSVTRSFVWLKKLATMC